MDIKLFERIFKTCVSCRETSALRTWTATDL